jgi:hypothetical protein
VHRYRVYGLVLHANRELPGLLRSNEDVPDVVVGLSGQVPAQVPDPSSPIWVLAPQEVESRPETQLLKLSSNGTTFWQLRYRFPNAHFEFIFNERGDRIWATWQHAPVFEDIVAILLGPILGCVVSLRGIICLHGSGVSAGARGLAILGPRRRGKSTLAALLSKQGYAVLSDDIVALSERDEMFWAEPGYSRLRLRPESVEALSREIEELPKVLSFTIKRYLDLQPNPAATQLRFEQVPTALSAIYILGRRNPTRSTTSIQLSSRADALMALVGNSYVDQVLTPALRARRFESLTRLVEKVPVKFVLRPDGLDVLPELCQMIRSDFEQVLTS